MDVLQSTIRKLTFENSIDLIHLCEHSYKTELGNQLYFSMGDELLESEYIKTVRRYGRIFKHLTKEKHQQETAGFLLDKPKLYSDILFKHQLDLYNKMAKSMGVNEIEKVLPNALIYEAATLVDTVPDYNTICQQYPYYASDSKKGINFIEFILLINIYTSVHKRSLKWLNTPLDTKESTQKVKDTIDRIINNMQTKEMYFVYVEAFFDCLEEIVSDRYDYITEKYIRDAWLPEKYKNRKDVYRAFETHKKKLKQHYYHTEPTIKDLENIDCCERLLLERNIDEYLEIDFIASDVIPLAYMILTEADNPDITDEETNEYIKAKEYVSVINKYIECAQDEVRNVLESIYK